MIDITATDWDALQELGGRIGLAERVAALRRRLESGRNRPGAPYLLLAGRPDAGIERLLAGWLGPEAAENLKKAGSLPLVIGPRPEEVRPRLSSWPTWRFPRLPVGHLIALRTPVLPPADVTAQLAALGLIDQMVLVTRLFMAMHERERELAEAMASLAATGRVVLIGLPGEEPTPADLAEVPAFAVHQMRLHGFDGGRCLGADLWFASDNGPAPATLTDPADLLQIDASTTEAGRAGMSQRAVAQLLKEVWKWILDHPEDDSVVPPVPEEERERLTRELSHFLADLGREVERSMAERLGIGGAHVRRFAGDAIRGWGAYTTVEGHWMKYVERLRPGLQAALVAEAQVAADCLDFRAKIDSAPAVAPTSPLGLLDRVILEAKRLAVGLACGLAVYYLAGWAPSMPPGVRTVVQVTLLALGGILGYAFGCHLFRGPVTPLKQIEEVAPEPTGIQGWTQFERRLTSWFAERINTRPLSVADSCRALAGRFGIEEVGK